MIKRVQLIGHIKTAADLFLGFAREVTVNTTANSLRVHDGATIGGFEVARADVANVPAAGVVDGKMTVSQAGDLSTAKTDITTLQSELDTAEATIVVHTADIATNVSGIATNVSGIATNVTNISTNVGNIASNVTNIGTNVSGIAANVTSIGVNAGNIASNLTSIGVNAAAISVNAGNITTNAGNITTNINNISTNTTNIATNATNIATNVTNISTNTSAISTHSGSRTEHPVATTSLTGFMTGADKTKLNGIETAATADQTAAQILTAIKTVDGAGSGLDADLLDGLSQTAAASVNTIMRRDAAGRAKVVSPSASTDIAIKSYVDVTLGAPVNTKLILPQASAPTGWIQDTDQNDRVLRVVSGAGGGTAGSWTISGITVNGTAISIAQMPAHTHDVASVTNTAETTRRVNTALEDGAPAFTAVDAALTRGGGATHIHGLTIGSAWRPAYQDVIKCNKT